MDAGIANRLIGAQQKGNYRVKETDIILFPSRIMFAAPKGRNPELLSLLDRHLDAQKKNENSVYHHAQARLILPGARAIVPPGRESRKTCGRVCSSRSTD